MQNSDCKKTLLSILLLVLVILLVSSSVATAATVTVDCSSAKAKIKTIKDGLAQLPAIGPSTLLVSGTCHENVVIERFQYLTVQGNPTATIDGGDIIPGRLTISISILSSREVTLNDLTVTGSVYGVGCGSGYPEAPSVCFMKNVTVENASGGVIVFSFGFLRLVRSTIQNNIGPGLILNGAGATAVLRGTAVQENGGLGVIVGPKGSLTLLRDDTGTPTVIQNNGGTGIDASLHGTIDIGGARITGNDGHGMRLMGGSVARMGNYPTITGNSRHGVVIGDLSFVDFSGQPDITGNFTPDVVCDQPYSATRGIQMVVANGGTTNCPPEPAPTP